VAVLGVLEVEDQLQGLQQAEPLPVGVVVEQKIRQAVLAGAQAQMVELLSTHGDANEQIRNH
jgi:hypothetical protein